MNENYFNQHRNEVRFEWGLKGLEVLAPISECVVIVDIMSFSTCVEIATTKGAIVLPYPWKDESAIEYGKKHSAIVASSKRRFDADGFSLSPTSLLKIPENTHIVLPSPNGSTCSFYAREKTKNVLIGSLRNALATAKFCRQFASVAVIACGERWENCDSLRPCLEDFIGAGAIISHLQGIKSPEALSAEQIYISQKENLVEILNNCGSGIELIERGFIEDVKLCSQVDMSNTVCLLTGDEIKYKRI